MTILEENSRRNLGIGLGAGALGAMSGAAGTYANMSPKLASLQSKINTYQETPGSLYQDKLNELDKDMYMFGQHVVSQQEHLDNGTDVITGWPATDEQNEETKEYIDHGAKVVNSIADQKSKLMDKMDAMNKLHLSENSIPSFLNSVVSKIK